MSRMWVVAVAFFWAGAGLGQIEPKPTPGAIEATVHDDEVEVKFGDGSSVRMKMVQESVDIVTKFGTLTVPMREIRKIEFGVHSMSKTVEAAMNKLASASFKDREEAVRELVKIGPPAFPALQGAVKSGNAEVGTRAQAALKKLQARYPPEALRLAVDDRIVTDKFPIVGRIVTPAIMAQTPIFGTHDLNKLPGLRTVQWLGKVEVVVVKSLHINDVLTFNDPPDRVRPNCRHKVHTFRMKPDTMYVIDMISNEFDAYLRLEDSSGQQLAQDDDSGGNLNARIFFQPKREEEFRIIATTFGGGAVGRYILLARPAAEAGGPLGK